MKKDLEKELFSFIKGAQKAKPAFIFALPMIVYILHRLFQRFVRLRRGLPFNRLVLAFVILTFCVTLVIMIRNIADILRLKKRLGKIMQSSEAVVIEQDYRFGTVYLDRNVILGRKYIISKGSSRLFSYDELSGVFDDIRDTYNVVSMILHGADDVVKTKIIKAEYKGKNFLHDRRICEIEVHKNYLSDIGQTNGYEQLSAIEKEIREKIADRPPENS